MIKWWNVKGVWSGWVQMKFKNKTINKLITLGILKWDGHFLSTTNSDWTVFDSRANQYWAYEFKDSTWQGGWTDYTGDEEELLINIKHWIIT